jgi:hypothetical protein
MNWMEPFVKRAITEKERREKEGLHTAANENVILDFLASKTDGKPLVSLAETLIYLSPDVEHIRHELITYLIASRDTVSVLCRWDTVLTRFLDGFAAHLRSVFLRDVPGRL